ncbi:MAG: hypothetical protein EAX86_00850 [Candidatus Heimdallarchaeota archaeon]|nr:hypothetical protein [Candidatus Heimdallarchaeota archaeon]
MNDKFNMTIAVHFETPDESRIVFEALYPEIQQHSFDRSNVQLKLRSNKLIIQIRAQDLTAAKASTNSMLRWLSTVSTAVAIISKHTFNHSEKSSKNRGN